LEGTKSNRSAIGAKVTLFWNGHQQAQEVSGAAASPRRMTAVAFWDSAGTQASKKL